MKIKNTRELVLRAQGHARSDHVLQGTYGEGRVNGEIEFKGCAIGCLATPHRKTDLRAFLKGLINVGSYVRGDGSTEVMDDEDRQLKALQSEFGICYQLARVAESLFEGQPTHGAAINFIPAFAAALNEGAGITPNKVRTAYRRALGDSRAHVGSRIRMATMCGTEQAPDAAEHFLAWLREQR